jgi:hypothetical protein
MKFIIRPNVSTGKSDLVLSKRGIDILLGSGSVDDMSFLVKQIKKAELFVINRFKK